MEGARLEESEREKKSQPGKSGLTWPVGDRHSWEDAQTGQTCGSDLPVMIEVPRKETEGVVHSP